MIARMRSRVAFILSFVFAVSALAHEEQKKGSATTILVVRHAEAEAGNSSDPGLSEAGQARAKALAAVAANAGVKAVYATQFARTKNTGAPAATAAGVSVTEVAVDRAAIAEQSRELAKRILTDHSGETVLIVGHSNTVPVIVSALGGVPIPEIKHDEFDRLYVIVHEPGKPVKVIAAKY
jgi:broad specificity phosphatase PhoE